MVARSEDRNPQFGKMLGDSLHDHAIAMLSKHLGNLAFNDGWTPEALRLASPAISEILRETVPMASSIGGREAVDAMDGGYGYMSAMLWCIPYLAVAEHIAAILRDKGE